jgi:hypothetical protein
VTRYHYVITLQGEMRNSHQSVTYESGTITPEPGQTRSDLFRQVFNSAAGRCGPNPVPLFFSLEPDELEQNR